MIGRHRGNYRFISTDGGRIIWGDGYGIEMFPGIKLTFFHNSFYAEGKNLLHGFSCVSHGIEGFRA